VNEEELQMMLNQQVFDSTIHNKHKIEKKENTIDKNRINNIKEIKDKNPRKCKKETNFDKNIIVKNSMEQNPKRNLRPESKNPRKKQINSENSESDTSSISLLSSDTESYNSCRKIDKKKEKFKKCKNNEQDKNNEDKEIHCLQNTKLLNYDEIQALLEKKDNKY